MIPPNDDDDGDDDDDDDDDGMLREDKLRGRVDVPEGEEDGEAEDRARGDQGLAANLVKVSIFFLLLSWRTSSLWLFMIQSPSK